MDSAEIIENSQIPLTQDTIKRKSVNQYAWAILFNYDLNNSKPFSIVKLREFAKCDFSWRAIKGEMTRDFRIQCYEFSCFPEKKFSIFGKIQYGNIYI